MNYIHSEDIHNTTAANIILPKVFSMFKVESVLDVGCGIGTWLSVCKDLGILNVRGIDGSNVDLDLLRKYLDLDKFTSLDLNQPFQLDKRYDLSICLEVAEHLNPESSINLVKSLVRHSDVILFSAAIPGQGGQNHLNEQTPEYWERLFQEHDFRFVDCIRPLIWNDSKIDFWYKQNIFLVLKNSGNLVIPNYPDPFHRIHPDLLIQKNKQIEEIKRKLEAVLNGSQSFRFYLNLLKKSIIR